MERGGTEIENRLLQRSWNKRGGFRIVFFILQHFCPSVGGYTGSGLCPGPRLLDFLLCCSKSVRN